MSDAVGPFTVTAVIATIAIVIVLANTALSAFATAWKDVTGSDIFMQPQYVEVWSKVSQFAWAVIAVTLAAAAFTVWRVIKER
jgi:outer membrane protein assembly factor BamE (lipoprotein component of BamABCDE complex)